MWSFIQCRRWKASYTFDNGPGCVRVGRHEIQRRDRIWQKSVDGRQVELAGDTIVTPQHSAWPGS